MLGCSVRLVKTGHDVYRQAVDIFMKIFMTMVHVSKAWSSQSVNLSIIKSTRRPILKSKYSAVLWYLIRSLSRAKQMRTSMQTSAFAMGFII